MIALAAAVALNALILGFIVVAKFVRERRETFVAQTRDAITETLMPLLEESGIAVQIPPPRGLTGATALETIVGLIAVLKGEMCADLVRLLEEAGYIDWLLRSLRSRDAVKRARSAMLLGGTHSAHAIEKLADLVRNDPTPEVRIVAAEALGAINGILSMPLLLEAARDPGRYQELRIADVLSHRTGSGARAGG